MTGASDAGQEIAGALERAGIAVSVPRFVELIVAALAEAGSPRAAEVPESQLTAAEIQLLQAGGMSPSTNRDAYDKVRAQTAARSAAILARAISVTEAAARLGVDPSRVRQMLADRSLVGVKDHGEWRILEVQFAGERLVPGIGTVLQALPAGIHPLAVVNWLKRPDPDLEIDAIAVSPLDWLTGGGDPAQVAALASDL